MSFLLGRDGKISLVRASVLIGVVGFAFLVIGILSFTLDQQSRRAPLDIAPPPGAQPWGAPEDRGPGWRFVYYRVPNGDASAVATHYDQKMREHYGTSLEDPRRETCERFPPQGEFPDYDLQAGTIPFYYICLFDRSGLNSTQWTQVDIQPGVPNEDPFLNSLGSIVIVYEQRWQP